MSNNQENYQDKMVIERERMRKDRLENSAQSHERNLKEALKEALHDANTRRNVAKDIVEASRGRTNDPLTDRVARGVGGGMHADDNELITGFEDRPWERD